MDLSFVLAVLLLSAINVLSSGQKCIVESDTKIRFGSSSSSRERVRTEDCCELCEKTESCVGALWKVKGSSREQDCWLMSTFRSIRRKEEKRNYFFADLDECAANRYDCPKNNTMCENTEGSYNCICSPGFEQDTDNECIDMDECQRNIYNCTKANTACTNIDGSYKCVCATGYKEINATEGCTDIDECKEKDTCKQPHTVCQNTVGSYLCNCASGYEDDGAGQCKDIDECTRNSYDCSKTHTVCQNTEGGYECPCDKGYEGDAMGACKDIDECTTGDYECKKGNTMCNNIQGSYNCICKSGYAENEHKECKDIDECLTNTFKCPKDHTVCKNTIGAYECPCDFEYKKDSKGECMCHGYSCICPPGFKAGETATCRSIAIGRKVTCGLFFGTKLNGTNLMDYNGNNGMIIRSSGQPKVFVSHEDVECSAESMSSSTKEQQSRFELDIDGENIVTFKIVRLLDKKSIVPLTAVFDDLPKPIVGFELVSENFVSKSIPKFTEDSVSITVPEMKVADVSKSTYEIKYRIKFGKDAA